MEINIRKLKKEELPEAAEVFFKSFNSVGEKWNLETCLKRLEQYYNENSCWAAEVESKIAGILTSIEDNVTDHQELYIDIFAVDPKYHKSGIGAELIETAQEYARNKDYKGLWLSAGSELPSYKWYLARGFKEAPWRTLYREF